MRVFALAFALFIAATASVPGADTSRFEHNLKRLALPERLEQLCDFTAMNRIRESTDFRPDRAVAGATSEPTITGHTILANGAAFRSHKKWYALSFACTADPDHLKVINFTFTVGGEIPENKWKAYSLWD